MGAVHRVAGLESHHPLPPELVETGPQLGRGQAERLVVVMDRRRDHLQLARNVDRVDLVQHERHPRVRLVRAPVHALHLMGQVRPVELGYMEGGQHHSFDVPEGQAGAGAQLGRLFLRDIEDDRDGPYRAVRQPHPVAYGLVIFLSKEPSQRGETAVAKQLQVAELAGSQVPRGPGAGLLLQLHGPFGCHDEVHQHPAVGTYELLRHFFLQLGNEF